MKNLHHNAKRASIFVLLFLGLFLNSCEFFNDEVEPETPPLTDKRVGDLVLPPTTHLLNSTSLNALNDVSENSNTLTFSNSPQLDSVNVGDILMIGVTPLTPNGLLRRITAVERNGGIQIETVQASLNEAIKEGSFSLIKNINPEDIAKVELEEGVTQGQDNGRLHGEDFSLSVEKEVTIGSGASQVAFKLEGSLNFDPDIEFDMDFEYFEIKSALFKSTLNSSAELTSSITGSTTFESSKIILAKYTLKPIVLYGIVLVPVINIYAQANGTVAVGIATTYSASASGSLGIRYEENSGWDDLNSFSNQFDVDPLNPVGNASVKLTIAPDIKIYLYGLIGPGIEIKPYIKANVDLTSPKCWDLRGGIEATAKIDSEILGERLKVERGFSFGVESTLLEGAGCAEPGYVQGWVKDAITDGLLEDVTIKVFKENVLVVAGLTEIDGSYNLQVPPGEGYKVIFEKPGYLTSTKYDVEVESDETTIIEGVLTIDEAHAGTGSFGGIIVDAFNGEFISNANLTIRSGLGNIEFGEVIATTLTSTDGSYIFENLPAGHYTVEATKDGYNPAFFTALCIGNQTTGQQNGTMSPLLAENEIRIVLTWGQAPFDLDAHITGPAHGGGRFHTYYYDLNPVNSSASLDLDDVTSYGPETITISDHIDGVYRYTIHDYTNKWSTSSNELAFSGAKVKVYKGNQDGAENSLIAEFNVPNQPGTLWTVFEMEGEDFRAINSMSYESDPQSVQRLRASDADLMRTLPEKVN